MYFNKYYNMYLYRKGSVFYLERIKLRYKLRVKILKKIEFINRFGF